MDTVLRINFSIWCPQPLFPWSWPLGQSSTANTYLTYIWNGEVVQVRVQKEIRCPGGNMEDKASAIEKFVAEFSDICHPDIAPTIFLRAEPSPTHHGVLLKIDRQYYPNGNIIEWLKMHPDDLIPLAIGAANGLEHLHSKGMVHGGICGDRVFVDNAGQAVLVDPGLAAVTGTYDFRWLAPEVMQDESDEPTKLLTKESDVYAFGIMLSEMISPDETPFSHIKGPKICLNVARGGRQLKPQGMSAVAQQLWNLAEKCWHPEPCERHSMHAVIQELIRLAQ